MRGNNNQEFNFFWIHSGLLGVLESIRLEITINIPVSGLINCISP